MAFGNKTVCPFSTKQSLLAALLAKGDVKLVIGGKEFVMQPKQMSTGSVGYNVSDKMEMEMLKDGKPTDVKFQVGLNVIAVGSKELPEG